METTTYQNKENDYRTTTVSHHIRGKKIDKKVTTEKLRLDDGRIFFCKTVEYRHHIGDGIVEISRTHFYADTREELKGL